MATTAKGTPYVESSDLVADYPTVSLALAEHIDDFGGKVLQVVRATDSTNRFTTSTSFVDANISVTITPQKSTSAVLLIWSFEGNHGATADYARFQITDSSNNGISGAQGSFFGYSATGSLYSPLVSIAYATPATTSATTYKGRFAINASGTAGIYNGDITGQLFAIEVSA